MCTSQTKKIFSRDELEQIATLCKKHDVIVISDEVYEWLFYPGTEHIRMGRFVQLRCDCLL